MQIQPHLEQKMRLNSSNSKPSRKLKMIRRLNGDETTLMTFFEPAVLKVKVFTYA